MKGLAEIITEEFRNIMNRSDKVYSEIERYMSFLSPDEQGLWRGRIRRVRRGIRKTKQKYYSKNPERREDFSAETFEGLQAAQKVLDNILPDDDEIDELTTAVMTSFHYGTRDISLILKKLAMPALGFNSALGIAASAFLNSGVAAFAYTASAFSAFSEYKGKHNPLKIMGATFGQLAATTILGTLGIINLSKGEYDPVSFQTLALGMSVALQAVAVKTVFPVIVKYSRHWAHYRNKGYEVEGIRQDFDKFLRYEVVIQEARVNLRYVRNVCQSEKRSMEDFQDQVDNLERVLGDYVRGNASYDDVLEARVKYVPKTDNGEDMPKKKKKKKKTRVPKMTYTPTELRRLREERQQRPNLNFRVRDMDADAHAEAVEERKENFRIVLGGSLKERYDKGRERIGRYGIVEIVDIARQKLESHPEGGFIRKTQQSIQGYETLIPRHGLDENVDLFKKELPGFIRAVYTMNNGTVTLLEVVEHATYLRLLGAKSD